LAAHVLGGGRPVLHFIPLLAAAALGVLTTFIAARAAGITYRPGSVAFTMLGAGQLGMHLILSVSASDHPDLMMAQGSPGLISLFGLGCGVLATHTAATAVMAILLLGAHQSASAAFHLMCRAYRRLRVLVVLAPRSDDGPSPAVVPSPDRQVVFSGQQWCRGLARPRRGPPRVCVR
jgi:hypothetical protein